MLSRTRTLVPTPVLLGLATYCTQFPIDARVAAREASHCVALHDSTSWCMHRSLLNQVSLAVRDLDEEIRAPRSHASLKNATFQVWSASSLSSLA